MKKRIRSSILALGVALLSNAGSVMATTSILNSTADALTVTGYTEPVAGGAMVVAPETTSTGCVTTGGASGCTPQMAWYSGGYGISTNAADNVVPNHAMDNNLNQESLLLNFGTSTKLQSININYKNTDSDITVLAWKPGVSGAPAPTFNSSTKYSNLIAAGWSLVGNYADLAVGTTSATAKLVNVTNPVSSSFWLVMAYDNAFGAIGSDTSAAAGNTSPTGASLLSTGNDYVKFYSVTYTAGTNNKVPEPSTALLFGAGVFGLIGWRARKQAAK